MALRIWLATILGVTLSLSVGAAVAATKRPQPPPQICIGSNCVTTPDPSSNTGTLKFHPGFYAYFDYAGGDTLGRLGNGSDGKDLQLINSLKPNDNLAGIGLVLMWTTLDRGTTTGPQYDWSVPDAYMAAAKAVGKRVWMRVNDSVIAKNWSVAAGKTVVPKWLVSKYGAQNVMVNYAPVGTGLYPKRYSPVVTGAYIDLMQAIAARYDSDPMFEGIVMYEETAMGVDTSGSSVTINTPGADYSHDAMFTQLYRLMAAMRDPAKGFKTSNVQLPGSYLFKGADSPSAWTDVLSHVEQHKMVLGGPDSWIPTWTYPRLPMTDVAQKTAAVSIAAFAAAPVNPDYKRSIYADEVYRGWKPGTTDWRDRILFGPLVEVTDFGGYITKNMNPIPTLAEIYKVRGGIDRAQYFFFDINYGPTGNYGGAPQQWAAQYQWVKSAGATNTKNPYD
jgi:hypothetical protein